MNSKTNVLEEIIGWYGAVALIGAYALNSFGVLAATGIAYQVLNVTGAIGIVYISIRKRAYQPAALNAIWTVIGIVALARVLF